MKYFLITLSFIIAAQSCAMEIRDALIVDRKFADDVGTVHEMFEPLKKQVFDSCFAKDMGKAADGYAKIAALNELIKEQFCDHPDDKELCGTSDILKQELNQFDSALKKEYPNFFKAYASIERVAKYKLQKAARENIQKNYTAQVQALALPGISREQLALHEGMKEVEKMVKPYKDGVIEACKRKDYSTAIDWHFKCIGTFNLISRQFVTISYVDVDDDNEQFEAEPELSLTQSELVKRLVSFDNYVSSNFPEYGNFLHTADQEKISNLLEAGRNWACDKHINETLRLKLPGVRMILASEDMPNPKGEEMDESPSRSTCLLQ